MTEKIKYKSREELNCDCCLSAAEDDKFYKIMISDQFKNYAKIVCYYCLDKYYELEVSDEWED